MAPQGSGEPPDRCGGDVPVRPVHARPWVGAAQDGDFVAQHEKLDVLGGGGAAHSRSSPSTCRKIKYSSRSDTPGSCPTSDHRSSATQARLLAPHRVKT